MGPYVDPHIVSWVVFFPMATAILLLISRAIAVSLFDSRGAPGVVWRAMAMAGSTMTFALAAIGLWGGFDPEVNRYQLVERVPWLPSLGVNYFVGLDGIALVLVLLTTFLVPLALLSSWNEVRRSLKSYAVLLLFLESGILGVLTSLNLVQLYFFWELTLIACFFMIGRWGADSGLRAAVRFLVFGLAGSLLMFVAMLIVFRLNLEQAGGANFDLVQYGGGVGKALLETVVPIAGEDGAPWWKTQRWLFGAFFLAFAIKIPLVPMHSWFVDAHAESPAGVAAILSGLLLKLGIFALLRIAIPLFPVAVVESAPVISVLVTVGLLYASLLSLAQRDLKRLIAYLSLAHLHFIVMGIFTLKPHAVMGSVVQMLSHGLVVAVMFILIGFLVERGEKRRIEDFAGLAKPMPVFATLFGIALLGSIGTPGLAGFVGGFLVFLGSFAVEPKVAIAAMAGMVVATGALLRMYGRIMLGPLEKSENRGFIDLDIRERVSVVLALIPLFWIGLHPNPILRRLEPPINSLLHQVDTAHREVLAERADRESKTPSSLGAVRAPGSDR
jgi:NADH-quinone oxidoreductase subunit M